MGALEARPDSRRKLIEAGTAAVFAALSDPARVARWWGPGGLTNTIQVLESHPGGWWLLAMHSQDGMDGPSERTTGR